VYQTSSPSHQSLQKQLAVSRRLVTPDLIYATQNMLQMIRRLKGTLTSALLSQHGCFFSRLFSQMLCHRKLSHKAHKSVWRVNVYWQSTGRAYSRSITKQANHCKQGFSQNARLVLLIQVRSQG